ncbi:hypothetical protein ANCDUO_13666 [Ancylostoma duodenale]|uniref:Uncharacterized protein n=1 Tax=Ancylostoma duodenale TaxID=51022 RepID=A0A0C2CID5_9BILA|nr:hypothetical protein ANCDUO_13666 [Ancylostoma duodenale]
MMLFLLALLVVFILSTISLIVALSIYVQKRKLYDYEVVEIFIANDKNKYVEVELGPHQQWLCLLLDGQRKSFNEGEFLQLSVWNRIDDNKWIGEADIPLAYLPASGFPDL